MREEIKEKLEEANKLIFVKNYQEAEEALVEILRSAPGKRELVVHLRYIELMARLNQLEEARQDYLRLMATPEDCEILELCVLFIDQHSENTSSADCVKQFQEHIKRYGPSAAAFYGIGFSLEMQKNFDRAIFNYQESIKLDANWFPSYFGLSQIYYFKGDEKSGDHFFYLFEEHAPYNVYGNFETHKKLAYDFLERQRVNEAESAIKTLGEWWTENKGYCPPEIQVYEYLLLSRISEIKGDKKEANTRMSLARSSALSLLNTKVNEGVLLFIARSLEEFGQHDLALDYYKRIIQQTGHNSQIINKIGSQLIVSGEYDKALQFFDEAYLGNPDDPEIRFGLLVTKLKKLEVNVEQYLISKERLRQLIHDGNDKAEILSLLQHLLAKFDEDPEVHRFIAELYEYMGHKERAKKHYEAMHRLDPLSRQSVLQYASYMMQHGDPDQAIKILETIKDQASTKQDLQAEIYWLKANFYARKKDFEQSKSILEKVLNFDPWNISYLVQQIINLTTLSLLPEELKIFDQVLQKLGKGDDHTLDWHDFDLMTLEIERHHCYELAYARNKLRYLYAEGDERYLMSLIGSACKFDATKAAYDFMRLLNTNFDSPEIYFGLGVLYKELWQLETASVWFEQTLLHPYVKDHQRSKVYWELADCYIWRNKHLPKAIEYAKLALEMGYKDKGREINVLVHGYLRNGDIKQADGWLQQNTISNEDPERLYLSGLIQYRNGFHKKANEIWKPLLTYKSESLRFHNIKQEVLRYYFEKDPYLKAN